jgi:hypothetical protein
MGYTHYWTFKKPAKGKADETEALYQKAIKDIASIALHWNATCIFDSDRLSGYTAHVKSNKYGGVKINGKKENAHEDFILREHYKENLEGSNGIGGYHNPMHFCKTAQKPYDDVIVASLIVLKHYLGDLIEVSSDGRFEDWENGLQLAKRVLKRRLLKIPLEKPKLCCKSCNREL